MVNQATGKPSPGHLAIKPAGEPAPSAPPAISVRGLTKFYTKKAAATGQPALDDVDLDVHSGEFLVLLGPSGCGKTTLLRSIAGLERPDRGTIQIHGRTVLDTERRVDVDASRRSISMIFQSYALWPHMTAAKNVAFALRCRGVRRSEIPSRVSEILEKLDIGHLADRLPSRMSGGQQQRLALARSLAAGQSVILFDEPLSNVDAQVREKLRLELIRMQRSLGFTAIYVTHDQAEAMELADRIAIMREGRIVQLDMPRALYTTPQDVHVARFLGQSNEIPLVVEHFDATSGIVRGRAPFGEVAATWLPGRETTPPSVGESLVAFGRPSEFSVAVDTSRPTPDPLMNCWIGRMEAVRFVGSHLEHVVDLGSHRLRCFAGVDNDDGPTEGAAVMVEISATCLRAMRDLTTEARTK